ncbi:MAG: hypothetical protein DVB22_000386 [Verrucomicrobia bacterium]|nr:MAG: hypothetical protein DVB22_000386 [Verrucomicrobiota bacterium]
MKLRDLPTLCAALLALCPTLATAQTSAVPGFISYQGRVVDAAGANVGAGTPVNRTVIFRIWDNPSSTNTANLIYSESQTVTVSDGEFSVLVGQGVANTTETFSYSEASKKLADFSTAFNGSARYLGVTVAAAATIATTDNEITPRQQIVSTAFAMRAKFAESIGSSSDLVLTPLSGTASNYGLGWYGTGRLFGTTAVDGPVLYGNAGGALGSNASGTYNTALRWDASGRVGIGATAFSSLTNKLTLQGDMATTPGDQFIIRGNADNNKRLLLGYDTTNNRASLQSYTAASTAGPLLLNPSGGNVGIGSATTPSVALDVTGAIKASGGLTAANISVGQLTASGDLTAANISAGQITASSRVMANSLEFWGALPAWGGLFQQGAAGLFGSNTSAVAGEIVLVGAPKLHLATTNAGAAAMTVWGSNVGIGKAAPSVALDVTGAVNASTTITAGTAVAAGTSITAGTTIAAGTTITAGGKSVPTSDENNLKIIRGTVKADGNVVYGSGFTATKVAGQTGLYRITFTTPFSFSPSVTTSITGRYGIKAEVYNGGRTSYPNNATDALYPDKDGFTVGVLDVSSNNAYNFGFQFIAIGPR